MTIDELLALRELIVVSELEWKAEFAGLLEAIHPLSFDALVSTL